MKQFVSFEETKILIRKLVQQIQKSEFKPDTIVALSTGGFPIAAALAKQLGISGRSVIGIPTYKDENGDYHIDQSLIQLKDFTGHRVLVVDEASKRGLLMQKAVKSIKNLGSDTKGCALLAWSEGIQPDFVVEACGQDVPDFYWEETR